MSTSEAFDRCWHLVEHHRFSSIPPSQIAQMEILAALKNLLYEPATETQGTQRYTSVISCIPGVSREDRVDSEEGRQL